MYHGLYVFVQLIFFCIASLVCNGRPGIIHACHLNKPFYDGNSQHLLGIIHPRCGVCFFFRARLVESHKGSGSSGGIRSYKDVKFRHFLGKCVAFFGGDISAYNKRFTLASKSLTSNGYISITFCGVWLKVRSVFQPKHVATLATKTSTNKYHQSNPRSEGKAQQVLEYSKKIKPTGFDMIESWNCAFSGGISSWKCRKSSYDPRCNKQGPNWVDIWMFNHFIRMSFLGLHDIQTEWRRRSTIADICSSRTNFQMSRELTYFPPWERKIIFKHALGKGYVSC